MENNSDPQLGMSPAVTSTPGTVANKKRPFREVLPKKGEIKCQIRGYKE